MRLQQKTSDGTISKVEFYNGTTLLHTETVIPYGYWWKNVPVGNYTLTAKAYDNSGNVTTSKAIKVSVVNYNVPPVVRIVTPVNNQTIGEHATFRFGVFAKDPNDKISSVKFYSGTTLLHTETVAPYGYWWKDIKAGTYTITAVATDDKGLSATSAPVHFTVVPNKIPTVNIITPANNKTFTAPATIDFEAVAKDADGKSAK